MLCSWFRPSYHSCFTQIPSSISKSPLLIRFVCSSICAEPVSVTTDFIHFASSVWLRVEAYNYSMVKRLQLTVNTVIWANATWRSFGWINLFCSSDVAFKTRGLYWIKNHKFIDIKLIRLVKEINKTGSRRTKVVNIEVIPRPNEKWQSFTWYNASHPYNHFACKLVYVKQITWPWRC